MTRFFLRRKTPRARPRFVTFAIVLVTIVAGNAVAQPRFPLNVSVGTQSLTVPWHTGPVSNRFNPVLVAGTDGSWKSGDRTRLYGALNVGFFQNYWWMTGVFISTELGAGYEFPIGLHADARLGVGYLHYYWRRETFVLEDGRYVPATDWGRPSVMVPLSVVLGYRGRRDHPLRVSPFVSAQWALQAPFTEEAPAMTHFFLAIGVRVGLGRSKTTGG